jgi:hypothetical protein
LEALPVSTHDGGRTQSGGYIDELGFAGEGMYNVYVACKYPIFSFPRLTYLSATRACPTIQQSTRTISEVIKTYFYIHATPGGREHGEGGMIARRLGMPSSSFCYPSRHTYVLWSGPTATQGRKKRHMLYKKHSLVERSLEYLLRQEEPHILQILRALQYRSSTMRSEGRDNGLSLGLELLVWFGALSL